MHWVLDCVEWKKRNEFVEVSQNEEDSMSYIPGNLFL